MPVSNAICLAEVGIGALRLGVPVEAVVEAIALPAAPGQLPRRRGALACVVEHGGRLVPVVDLARWVDVGTPARNDGARVLVLHQDGRTVGLKVDAVGGLVEVAPGDVTRLHHDDDPEEVFHSAARAREGGQVLSLLDCGRLAQLAAAWNQADAQADAQNEARDDAQSGHAGGTDERPYALLQVGAQRLAVPAEVLAEVIPMPPLERFGGGIDSQCCRWRGRHLPVLPPAALLPASSGSVDGKPAAPLLAVIERAGQALGLPVDAALQLEMLGSGGLDAPGGLTASAFDRDRRPLQRLDAAALFARFPEAALSRAAPPAEQAGQAGRNAGAYIVFEANGLAATAIEHVERILGPAEATVALDSTQERACMAWDGRALPVRDLRASAHAHAAPYLLVVRGAGGLHACAVARVHLLLAPGSGRVYRMGAGPRSLEFITTGESADQASYRIVDLTATP